MSGNILLLQTAQTLLCIMLSPFLMIAAFEILYLIWFLFYLLFIIFSTIFAFLFSVWWIVMIILAIALIGLSIKRRLT